MIIYYIIFCIQVIGLHGGALLGVAYRTSRRISPAAASAISSIQSMPLSGFGNSGISSFADERPSASEAAPQNFQLYRLNMLNQPLNIQVKSIQPCYLLFSRSKFLKLFPSHLCCLFSIAIF